MQACTQWTHSDIWSQLATTPECSFKIGERQSGKKWQNGDRRVICDPTRGVDTGRGVICHRGVSDGSDRAISPGQKRFLLMALERDGPTPFITQLMCLVVDQKLRGLEAFGCNCLYIERIHWLPMMSICMFTYNSWAPTDCQYLIKLSGNGAWTIFSLTFSTNKRLHSHILPEWL